MQLPLLIQYTTSELWCCLKVRGEIIRTVLCTVISTLKWPVLTVLWIGVCHTGPISLCIDLFVFISVYFVCFCFILHMCCIIVSTVRWTRWDWSLIVRMYLPSVLWHRWLGHLTLKTGSRYDLWCVWWDVKHCSTELTCSYNCTLTVDFSSLSWLLLVLLPFVLSGWPGSV